MARARSSARTRSRRDDAFHGVPPLPWFFVLLNRKVTLSSVLSTAPAQRNPAKLPHHVPYRGSRKEAQLFVQREAAENGLERAERARGLLGVIDPDGDNDRQVAGRDLVGLADDAGNVRIVVHRQVSGA